jgi:hypothetical protein
MGCASSRVPNKRGAAGTARGGHRRLAAAGTLEETATASGLTVAELTEFAEFMQVDAVAEPHLMGIVAEAAMAPLPDGWIECQDVATQHHYYYDQRNGETSWSHPLDQHYKNKLDAARSRFQSLHDPKSRVPIHSANDDEAAAWEYESEPLEWVPPEVGATGASEETVWVRMQPETTADLEAAFADRKISEMVAIQRRGHSGIRHSYAVCLREPMMQMNLRTGRQRRIRRTERRGTPFVIAVPVAAAEVQAVVASEIDASSESEGERNRGVVVQVLPGSAVH